jgi:hypothetical protein
MKKLFYVVAGVAVMYSCTKDELETPKSLNKIPESEILQATKSQDTVQPASTPDSEPTTTDEPIEKEEIKPGDV